MHKRLKVIIPGAQEQYFDIFVSPGMTVKDIKIQVPQLRDSQLFRAHNSLPCKETVDLFPSVRDGDNFYAASYQDVGEIFYVFKNMGMDFWC